MGLIKDIFKFKQSIPVVLLIIGVPLFVACSFDWFGLEGNHPHLHDLLKGLSSVIVMSALVSFLIDSVEFMGVFKRALEDIIYDSKFLRKRKDIEEIWVKVSKELFKSKFPQISTQLMMAVKNYYSPDENLKLNYYNDYRNTYTVKYDEQNHDFIHVESKSSYVLKVEDEKEFEFPMRYWTCVDEGEQETVEAAMSSITVNGNNVEDIGTPEKTYEKGTICYNFKLKLKGCTEYRIQQTLNQKYNLKEDNFLGFRARWLVKDMRIQLFHPADMKILFVNRATANGFEVNNDRETFKEYEYKGLILKHQGYIIILNRP